MRDPYEVLGIARTANENEIKQAYRNLARANADNEEFMSELDLAYDAIITSGGYSSGNSSSRNQSSNTPPYGTGPRYGTNSRYKTGLGDIREKIDSGRFDDADMLLDGIPVQSRDAEWFFLKGLIQHRRGWLDGAASNFAKAHSLDPDNREYTEAFERTQRAQAGGYRKFDNGRDGCGDCDKLCIECCCCSCLCDSLCR